MLVLGGPVFINNDMSYSATLRNEDDLEKLVCKTKEKGYKAIYCPRIDLKDYSLIQQAKKAFKKENIILSELGYWENMMDLDPDKRTEKRQKMIEFLILADELDALCAITTAGSFAYDSHRNHTAENFSEEAFEEIVMLCKYILDSAKPKKAKFTFEIYQFHFLDSIESIKRVSDAVNDDRYAVHLDLVNLLNSPRNYWRSYEIAKEFVDIFGEKIVSSHVKDVWMNQGINDNVEFKEVFCGEGQVKLAECMKTLSEIDKPLPYMMEHLDSEKEYDDEAVFLRQLATDNGVKML